MAISTPRLDSLISRLDSRDSSSESQKVSDYGSPTLSVCALLVLTVVCVDPPCVCVSVCDVFSFKDKVVYSNFERHYASSASRHAVTAHGSRATGDARATRGRPAHGPGDRRRRRPTARRRRGHGVDGRSQLALEAHEPRRAGDSRSLERPTNNQTTKQQQLNLTPRGAYTGYRVHGSSKYTSSLQSVHRSG